jgi:uncharacterized protein YybS (DUF2232 family)
MNHRSLLIATAQTLALYLSRFFIPIIGQILVLFTPVPLILAYVRDDRTTGTLALIAVAALTALFGGWYTAVVFVLGFGLMAVNIGEGMLRRMKPERIALLGGLIPAILVTLLLLLYFAHAGKDPVALAEQYLRDSVAEAAKTYANAGLTDMATAAASLSEAFIYYLVRLFPGIFIATMVTQAAFCFGIARAFIMRKQGAKAEQASLALWHAPDTWVWGLIASLAFLTVPNEFSRLAGWNLMVLFGTLYCAQGAALVDHFLRKIQMHYSARAAIMAIIMILPPILAGMIALGIVDIWADFRKVRGPIKTP